MQAFDWSGGKCRGKEKNGGQLVVPLHPDDGQSCLFCAFLKLSLGPFKLCCPPRRRQRLGRIPGDANASLTCCTKSTYWLQAYHPVRNIHPPSAINIPFLLGRPCWYTEKGIVNPCHCFLVISHIIFNFHQNGYPAYPATLAGIKSKGTCNKLQVACSHLWGNIRELRPFMFLHCWLCPIEVEMAKVFIFCHFFCTP